LSVKDLLTAIVCKFFNLKRDFLVLYYDLFGLAAAPFFLILDCEAIGTAATSGLLCQPRVIMKMIVEKQMECRLAGETKVLE
jgi:hypothetical protein